MTPIHTEPTYTLYMTSDNIGDLEARSPVNIGGVVVGRVADTMLDPKVYPPHITLEIGQCCNHIPDTSSLDICTSSLLGEQYLILNVGFKDSELGIAILKDGDTTQDIESAMALEDLIGQFPYSSKGNDNKNSGDTPAAAPNNNETAEPVSAAK